MSDVNASNDSHEACNKVVSGFRNKTYRRMCKFGKGTADGRRPRPIPGLEGPSSLRRQCCRVVHGRLRLRKDFQPLKDRNYEWKVGE